MSDFSQRKSVTAVILAAGFSSRMGIPKCFLPFDSNKIFIEQVADRFFEWGCSEIICVVNEDSAKRISKLTIKFPENVRVGINKFPELGRFFSLKTGLSLLQECKAVFVANIDNPFVSFPVLQALYEVRTSNAYAVPYFEGKGGHPILLSESICKDILTEQNLSFVISDYLKTYPKIQVPVKERSVIVNINTQEEYRRFFI